MSKLRRKNRSEKEYYLGIIRELTSEVRNLRKRLRQVEKMEYKYEEIVNEALENGEIEIKTKKNYCPHCGKGQIKEIDLNHLLIKRCSICGHEERIRSNGKKTES